MLEGLEGHILGIVLAAILICSTVMGGKRGLLLGLYGIVKNIVILIIAIGLAPVIAERLPGTMAASKGIGYSIAFIVSVFVFHFIGRLLRVVDDVPVISGINRIGGAVLGLVLGFLIAWSVLAVLGCLQEYTWCQTIVKSARDNTFVMWLQDVSPLPEILKGFGFPVI